LNRLIIYGICAVILFLLYLRLRPFIRMARRMFGVAREVQRVAKNPAASSTQKSTAGERLVRCSACGTWIPSGRALKLRASNTSYCSTACLERTAQGSQRKAAS
jgi:hypothetical protein